MFNFNKNDDLIGQLEAIDSAKSDINNTLKNSRLHKFQIGIVIFGRKGIKSIEAFDNPKSWKALHKNLIKRYTRYFNKGVNDKKIGKSLTSKENIIADLTQISKSLSENPKKELLHETPNSKTYYFEVERYIGEYTELFGEVTHFILSK